MGGYLTPDPAIEKWVRMRESTAPYFRWSARNVRSVALLGLVIPAGILFVAEKYDRQFQWAAKGPSPKAPAEKEEDA
ncbi:hypothetical protein BC939DRAFT_440958 [Gamsiella multidivaricata]|uniref:uncharacterized protein n=1 Tax=Gamsiella multidivaricata TaxID=101098 RepID=UPI00221EB0CA|nr:uncharacterized protein BC939DRAFT_440958 [Gamsiella multidivaricata]KAG0353404.1 hypothetical protein BGZ54_002262 [Gamsiella multidivaricata]KAI7829512.1 hypothetical protein BC939DRAFT_440958 [Gamsiella multidivaricata]